MDLILWRHAEAEDGSPDAGRALTRKGHKQAKQVAEWLRARLPKDARVISSPAKRALQTAAALTAEYEVVDAVYAAAGPRDLVSLCGWPGGDECVVLVGHQPVLGQAASLLLGGGGGEWSLKKGGLWWLQARARGGSPEVVVRAVVSPDML